MGIWDGTQVWQAAHPVYGSKHWVQMACWVACRVACLRARTCPRAQGGPLPTAHHHCRPPSPSLGTTFHPHTALETLVPRSLLSQGLSVSVTGPGLLSDPRGEASSHPGHSPLGLVWPLQPTALWRVTLKGTTCPSTQVTQASQLLETCAQWSEPSPRDVVCAWVPSSATEARWPVVQIARPRVLVWRPGCMDALQTLLDSQSLKKSA